jgi:hypothetical protein
MLGNDVVLSKVDRVRVTCWEGFSGDHCSTVASLYLTLSSPSLVVVLDKVSTTKIASSRPYTSHCSHTHSSLRVPQREDTPELD